MAREPALRRLRSLGIELAGRTAAAGSGRFITENGNLIADRAPASRSEMGRPRAFEAALLAIPGIVDMDLFLGTAERVLFGVLGGPG